MGIGKNVIRCLFCGVNHDVKDSCQTGARERYIAKSHKGYATEFWHKVLNEPDKFPEIYKFSEAKAFQESVMKLWRKAKQLPKRQPKRRLAMFEWFTKAKQIEELESEKKRYDDMFHERFEETQGLLKKNEVLKTEIEKLTPKPLYKYEITTPEGRTVNIVGNNHLLSTPPLIDIFKDGTMICQSGYVTWTRKEIKAKK